jgi:hypothetical protein
MDFKPRKQREQLRMGVAVPMNTHPRDFEAVRRAGDALDDFRSPQFIDTLRDVLTRASEGTLSERGATIKEGVSNVTAVLKDGLRRVVRASERLEDQFTVSEQSIAEAIDKLVERGELAARKLAATVRDFEEIQQSFAALPPALSDFGEPPADSKSRADERGDDATENMDRAQTEGPRAQAATEAAPEPIPTFLKERPRV